MLNSDYTHHIPGFVASTVRIMHTYDKTQQHILGLKKHLIIQSIFIHHFMLAKKTNSISIVM